MTQGIESLLAANTESTVVAVDPLYLPSVAFLVAGLGMDLTFNASPKRGRPVLHESLINVTAVKMARRSTRPLFHIDGGYLQKLNVVIKKTQELKKTEENTEKEAKSCDRHKLLWDFEKFLAFLAHVALSKSGFDIIVSENKPNHFVAHYLFFDPVASEPQIILLDQGYSFKSVTIDGLKKTRSDTLLLGVFWLLRAFNVLKHCVCGNILPQTSIRTGSTGPCECGTRMFKNFKTSQRKALDSYTCFDSKSEIAYLWDTDSIRIPGEMRSVSRKLQTTARLM